MNAGDRVLDRITRKSSVVGVIGLGYVGLPLAVAAASAGYDTIGFDIDSEKPECIHAGQSCIGAVSDAQLEELVTQRRLSATSDLSGLAKCDVIIICVPTPST